MNAFFIFPPSALVNRNLPKNKIYEHSGANTRLKDLFVAQVAHIVWQYKLAPETIKLAAQPSVPEIQVFAIALKTPELHLDVLRCIDNAIPSPIIFELSFDGQTQVIAAYKTPAQANATRGLLSNYFATPWRHSNSPRSAMPVALDLANLYEQWLQRLIPWQARPQESTAALVARAAQIEAKQLEINHTLGKIAKEKQFNRKVEINAHWRQLNQQLQELSR